MNITTVATAKGMNEPDEEQIVITMTKKEANHLLHDMELCVGLKLRPKTTIEKLALMLANKLL